MYFFEKIQQLFGSFNNDIKLAELRQSEIDLELKKVKLEEIKTKIKIINQMLSVPHDDKPRGPGMEIFSSGCLFMELNNLKNNLNNL